MPNLPDLLSLIEKYQSGTATDEEKRLLNEWYHSFSDEEVELAADVSPEDFGERLRNKIMTTLKEPGQAKIIRKRRTWYIPAAAAVLLMLLGTYFLLTKLSSQPAPEKIVRQYKATDAAPAGNKATLTLSDGSHIILDSVANGVINLQGNTRVQKLENGQLAYAANENPASAQAAVLYNIIATPRGGQYQVTLADGTKVWLNAASSIRFPVSFTGGERKVEITGEAYFEVAKNKAMPFKVMAGSSQIEVLGTHFNVNAYDDESSVTTTLMEGSVKVSAGENNKSHFQYLKPGQQASVSPSSIITVSDHADFEEVLAWKNGIFLYKGTDIHTILRQVSKWYDLDIEYRGNINMHFTGQIKRELYASKVLEKLALTDELHFKIEGKKVIVTF